jgi:autotransporter adhesin
MTAKARNDEADERFYNETVMKAAERDVETGALKNQALYDKYVTGALGADGYKVSQTTAEGRRLAEQAAVNVIGDAYSRNEAQRASNIKRFEAYMDKQVTKEVLRQYEDMIKYDNIDGIIASHNILSRRGDYDQIASHMRDYMNSGAAEMEKANEFEDPEGTPYSVLITDNWAKVSDGGSGTLGVITFNENSKLVEKEGGYTIEGNNPFSEHVVYIVPGGRCEGEVVKQSQKRHFAVLYRLEGAGVYCIDDQ